MINFEGIELENTHICLLDELFNFTLTELNQKASDFEVNLEIISPEDMQKLNKEKRNIDYATDVLSFPNLDDIFGKKITRKDYPFDVNPENNLIMLGDIFINQQKVIEQAKEFGHSYQRELCYLFVHALLHLMGYDHIEEKDKIIMRDKEEKILQKYNIKRDDYGI